MKQQLLAPLLSILFVLASTANLAQAELYIGADPISNEQYAPCHDAPEDTEPADCCDHNCLAHCTSAHAIFSPFSDYLAPLDSSDFDKLRAIQASSVVPDNLYRPPIIR